MYFVSIAVNNLLFVGLTYYVTAFLEDIEAIFNEVNDEMNSKTDKNSKLQVKKIDSSKRIIEVISVHNEMFKYLTNFIFMIFIPLGLLCSFVHLQNYGKYW